LFGYGANGDVMIDDPVFGQFDVPYSTTFTYNSVAGPLVWFLSIIS
jgi:hypothetical protein